MKLLSFFSKKKKLATKMDGSKEETKAKYHFSSVFPNEKIMNEALEVLGIRNEEDKKW